MKKTDLSIVKTLDWKCENCGNIAAILKPVTDASKAANEEAKELASQINLRCPHMANIQQQQQQQGSIFVPRFPFPPTFLPSMFSQMRMAAGNPFIAANHTSGFRSPFMNYNADPNSGSSSQTTNNLNLNNTYNTQSVPISNAGANISSAISASGMENDQIESLRASPLETERGEQDVVPPVTESTTTDGLRQRNIDSHPVRPHQGPSHLQIKDLGSNYVNSGKKMSSSKLLVVAIDFGTTYSGYAFSYISQREKVYTYNWSKGITQTPKTPTSILFTPRKDFHSFGYEAEEEYARLSQHKENRDWYFFKRFKLTLYKNEDLNEKTKIRDCTDKEMLAIEVFSGGIHYLKDHLITHFKERIPHLREGDIHWVLTLPAIWDEAAKSGTVDITVHEVRYDNSLKEIHRASGGPWGGIKVDDAFQEYLLELFGFDRIASLPKHEVIELERSFELLKKNVNIEDKNYHMQLPLILRQSANSGTLVAGKLRLSSRVVKGFFERPAEHICRKIEEILLSLRQLDLDTILLVGGFAESKLLQEEVQLKFPTMKVLKPNEPGAAVIKGAVEFGHCPEKVRFRMSPYTYGVNIASPFRHGKDPISKFIEIDGTAYCDDIFHIHVKKNQSVETDTEISNEDYHPMTQGQTNMNFKVATSDSLSPKYIDDPGNRIIGSFDVQIPHAFASLQRYVNVKMIFRGTELEVEAKMHILSKNISLHLDFTNLSFTYNIFYFQKY
ncbi:Heat shock 70 kDa protein 12B [Mytilus edulis]|uniref:Heat shock 70 kDa protein 12B n=1 Tax=Mytilus edulis TaxID=6550 RepID=A0A8S3T445_MYTED|nr:Heat shock 70 kDa protein 12B [Mytilus edulis]